MPDQRDLDHHYAQQDIEACHNAEEIQELCEDGYEPIKIKRSWDRHPRYPLGFAEGV